MKPNYDPHYAQAEQARRREEYKRALAEAQLKIAYLTGAPATRADVKAVAMQVAS